MSHAEPTSEPISAEIKQAAQALLTQLTLEEKAKLCSGKDFWHLEGIERLGLAPVMVTDGPHGLRKQGPAADHLGANKSIPATCFPTASSLASSWDRELMHDVGAALGEHCVEENVTVLLGPGMNIKRHPLCGRNFEYFSEDPLISGEIAAALVSGIQSQGVGACLKHFAVNNQEFGRMYMDAIVDPRTLREIYLKGFEIAVKKSAPWMVMCAYNRLNGEYCSEDNWLLNEVLRDEWGFDGAVVTDWGAANDRVLGVQSGLDLEMPSSGGINDKLVLNAVENGELSEADLNNTVLRNLCISLAGAQLPVRDPNIDLAAHHQLARRAATESCVLLKNSSNLLPINHSESVALIGAFAKKPRFQGAGSSQVRPTQVDTLFNALSESFDNLVYAEGFDAKYSELDQGLIDEAVAAAKACSVAIVYAGLPGIYESEGFDREHMQLPEQHNRLIQAVVQANPRTVVVLANGAPVEMPWIDQVPAVLEGYLAGQASGSAIADILIGLANPSGKLTETFPLSLEDIPSNAWFPGERRQIQYREGLYVGYRYFDSANRPVLFPFGHGLSYSSFAYSDAQISTSTMSADVSADPANPTTIQVSVAVKNTGAMAGAECVQVYRHALNSKVYRPDQELVGFAKVFLQPGEQSTVTIQISSADFAYFDQGMNQPNIEAGQYALRIGASSRDIRQTLELTIGDPSHQKTAQPSPQALNCLGPQLDQTAIQVADETFAQMLGKAAPKGESPHPFHANSSLAEIGETWLGAKIKAKAVEGFLKGMGLGNNDATIRKMFEEMANNMPLRGIVLFQQGKLSYRKMHLLLAVLNKQPLRAIKLYFTKDD
ncbi:glycoside hydrolase family 3 C-terminal domain-containing protein [Pseudomonadales bacterium]|nr:glycoside hydrolase family 3 C-terminal domain-containing protein [Pseudomonadales bacterium]